MVRGYCMVYPSGRRLYITLLGAVAVGSVGGFWAERLRALQPLVDNVHSPARDILAAKSPAHLPPQASLATLGADNRALIEVVKALREHFEDDFNDNRLRALARKWAAERREELMACLIEMRQKNAKDWAIQSLMEGWADVDGPSAMDFLTGPLGEAGNDRLMGSVVSRWAGHDAVGSLGWLERQPLSSKTGSLRKDFLDGLAQKNPSQAWQLATEHGWIVGNQAAAQAIFSRWAEADVDGGWQKLRELSAQGVKIGNWARFFISSAHFTPESLDSFIKGMSAEEMLMLGDDVAKYQVSRFPELAASEVENWLKLAGSEEFSREMLEQLPAETAITVASKLEGPRRLQTVTQLVNALSRDSQPLTPAAADAVFTVLQSATDRERDALASAAAILCSTNGAKSVQRFWEATSPSAQVKCAEGVFARLSNSDITAAWELAKSVSDPAVRKKAIPQIIAVQAKTDGPAALGQALAETDMELRSLAAGKAYAVWASVDQDTALKHLSEHVAECDIEVLKSAAISADTIKWSAGGSSSSSNSIRGFDTKAVLKVLEQFSPPQPPAK